MTIWSWLMEGMALVLVWWGWLGGPPALPPELRVPVALTGLVLWTQARRAERVGGGRR